MTGRCGGPSHRADDAMGADHAHHIPFLVCYLLRGRRRMGLSNVHQIPADSRAIILRLGAISGERGPGLLIAWPRPIEEVVTLARARSANRVGYRGGGLDVMPQDRWA